MSGSVFAFALRRPDWAGRAAPAWASATVVGLLLGVAWWVVYLAGGTRSALPHVFYVPIVLAAVPFGPWGAAAVGVAAAVLCGPAMPLDVATGEPQPLANWLTRGGFFVTVGLLAGSAVHVLRRDVEQQLLARFREELRLPRRVGEPTMDTSDEDRIDRVIAQRELHTVFQPIYSLRDGRLLAVEALARFHDEPYRPPDVVFAEAARCGRGSELELVAARVALDAVRQLPLEIAVSVNFGPDTLHDPRLGELLDATEGRQVVVELTEHAVVDDYARLQPVLTALRSRGVAIAVDDAGAGFASLRHIVRLQPEIIKLDPSLTQGVRTDPVRRALAAALVQFSTETGSQLVAEGIETEPDLTTWQQLGAHAAQGYLLGRPTDGPISTAPSRHVASQPTLRIASNERVASMSSRLTIW